MPDNEPVTSVDSQLGYTFHTDISQREKLAAAFKRWPLLAEFAEQKAEQK